MRDNLEFSDGSPLTADDVVRSWLRVIDPSQPSQLATLLYMVKGAKAYAEGSGDKSAVGIVAQGNIVRVTFTGPTNDFATIVASPTLAIVPASATSVAAFTPGPAFVASGGYIPISQTATQDGFELKANPHFWAGAPAIPTVTITWNLADRPEVAFKNGDVDYVPVFGSDALARLKPSDIHVAELHDAFTILEIAESEHVGFFKKGEGGPAAAAGKTRLGGQIPINLSGGLKARGHPVGATGVAQVVDIVYQLRHELPGRRQVSNAENGLTVNFGGFGNNVLAFVLRRMPA